MSKQLRAELVAELKRFPPGGPAQELFRLAFAQARLRGTEPGQGSPASPEGAREFAVNWVRQRYADFVPEEVGMVAKLSGWPTDVAGAEGPAKWGS